jgi:toxin ParE1/3/4
MRNIFSYIARDNPTAALKMMDTIEARTVRLADNSYVGAELPKEEYPFLASGYRRLAVSPFLIYYRLIEQTVYVTHVVHEKRNRQKALDETFEM